uniref:RNA-directed DNA polymerase, eukaryota n=1 Tax=Tanacetum cinerariifolium TaxID=118510 RepID=A0A699IN37_TANCI|nr:RNA-directed DNA polymerase, eukaryota [Tanacetum cinerariifolium]
MQTQTSNTLHNTIMEAGGKDRLPMLAPGIDNDIYFTVDACPNTCAMWKAIKRLKQGASINVQDLETNLYWEFRKFTSRDGESLKSYYSRFYKMMNELVRNQCNVTNHQNSSTGSQQAATRNRGKAIVNSSPPVYDQEPSMVAKDDKMLKDKEIDKFMTLISLSFKKIYKPINNNLQTSSNTNRANQDNSLRISRGTGYDNQRIGNVAGDKETVGTTMVQKSEIQCYNCKEYGHVARECQKPKRIKDASYHRKRCYCVTLDAADNFGPIFDSEPLQKVSNNDNYNMFAIESEHPEQSQSVNDTYLIEQDEHNVIIDSLDMSYDREQIDQDDDDDDNDLANERDMLASLIEKLKCEIDDSKNRNKFLETSNKALVDKLKGEIKDFKNKNKSLESSNNHFKEANNELSKTNVLMYKDLKKFQDRYNEVKYASKVEIDCAKAKGELISYKMEAKKSFNAYTRNINDLNQTFSKMKKELFAHQETISILSQAKEAQLKLYKTREDIELDKVIASRVSWMGGFHLFADVVKYGRTNNRLEERSGDSKPNEAVLGNKSMGVSGNNDASNSREKHVEVSVSNKANKESSNEALMFISEDDCIDLDGMERSILNKVKDLSVITDLLKYMSSEGFVDVGLRYVGGRWVWLEFDSRDRVESVKNSKVLNELFLELKDVSYDFISNERCVWRDLVGFPLASWAPEVYKKLGGRWGCSVFTDMVNNGSLSHGKVCVLTESLHCVLESLKVLDRNRTCCIIATEFAYWAPNIESAKDKSITHSLERKDDEGPSLDGGPEHKEPLDVDNCDSVSSKDNNNDSDSSSEMSSASRLMREVDVRGVDSDHVDSFEEGEIIGDLVLNNDGCVKDFMEKNLDDDVEKNIEDCSKNVTEKCGVVNNNMSNNVEGEILEDHFDGYNTPCFWVIDIVNKVTMYL